MNGQLEKMIMRTWTTILAGVSWVGAMGCAPQVFVQASSHGTSGEGGFHGSPSGAGGEGGTTSAMLDGGGAGGTGGGTPLAGAKYTTAAGYSDVVWDTTRNRVFLSGGSDGMVRVLDLKSSAWTSLTVGHRAEHLHFDSKLDLVLVSIAVQDHTLNWDNAKQSGYFARIDAATLMIPEPILLPLDPWEIASDGKNHAYIAGGSGQTTRVMVVNLTTGNVTMPFAAMISHGSSLQMPSDQKRIYAATTAVSPNTLHRYDLAGLIMPYPSFSGFDHPICGALRIHPAGTTMYSGCGNVFLATMSQDTDMTWTGDLGIPWRDLAFSADGKLAYLIPDKDPDVKGSVYKAVLYAVDTTSLKVVATYNLDAPAERVVSSESGLLLVRETQASDLATEIEVIP